ncbi:hypothetical protein BpHYR1_006504, partial [Brachionus plicatilis]
MPFQIKMRKNLRSRENGIIKLQINENFKGDHLNNILILNNSTIPTSYTNLITWRRFLLQYNHLKTENIFKFSNRYNLVKLNKEAIAKENDNGGFNSFSTFKNLQFGNL